MALEPLFVYTPANNGRMNKILIAAKYNEIEIKTPEKFEMRVDNKKPEYLTKFPLGKVPACDTPFGPLVESSAIMRYVVRLRPDTHLYGQNFYQQALVDQWIDWSSFELEHHFAGWYYTILGYRTYEEKTFNEARQNVFKALGDLNNHLASRTFVVGNQVTAADIVIVSALVPLFKELLPAAKRAEFGNVTRWFETCINQKQFADVLGKLTFATEERQYKAGAANGAPAATPAPAAEVKAADKPAPAAAETPKKEAKKESGKKESAKKGKAAADKPKEAEKPAEAPAAAPAPAAAAAPAETPKKEEAAKTEGKSSKKKGKGGAKAETPKKAAETPKKTEEKPKTAEPKKEEPKPATPETPKKEAAPAAAAPAADKKPETPKAAAPKAEAKPKTPAPKGESAKKSGKKKK